MMMILKISYPQSTTGGKESVILGIILEKLMLINAKSLRVMRWSGERERGGGDRVGGARWINDGLFSIFKAKRKNTNYTYA